MYGFSDLNPANTIFVVPVPVAFVERSHVSIKLECTGSITEINLSIDEAIEFANLIKYQVGILIDNIKQNQLK
jgi:hypothetical protein